jgi:GNAT superfamily N-acetyltransferase
VRVSVRSLTAPSSEDLSALAELFELYRVHYGQTSDAAGSGDWLARNLGSGRLRAFVAAEDGALVGFALSAEVPASLRLAHFWQLRDLYVLPACRRKGVGRALLDSVRAAATASGAIRLSVQTEEQNDPALALYMSCGYRLGSGYRTLVLPIHRTLDD